MQVVHLSTWISVCQHLRETGHWNHSLLFTAGQHKNARFTLLMKTAQDLCKRKKMVKSELSINSSKNTQVRLTVQRSTSIGAKPFLSKARVRELSVVGCSNSFVVGAATTTTNQPSEEIYIKKLPGQMKHHTNTVSDIYLPIAPADMRFNWQR